MVELTSPRKIYPLPSRLWQGKVKLKRLRAESIHPLATNTMMFLIMFSPDFMVEKYEKSRKILN